MLKSGIYILFRMKTRKTRTHTQLSLLCEYVAGIQRIKKWIEVHASQSQTEEKNRMTKKNLEKKPKVKKREEDVEEDRHNISEKKL